MKVLCSQVLHDELRCRLSSCPVAQQAAELHENGTHLFLLHANATQFYHTYETCSAQDSPYYL